MKLLPGKTYSFFLIKEFLKAFIVAIIFIMGLSFIVRTLQGIDAVREYSIWYVFIKRLLEAPEIISREALLSSCMFASVYTMSNLAKNREILALRSCGVSIYRIISPLIIIGFFIAIFSLFFEDLVVVRSHNIRNRYLPKLRGDKPREQFRDRKDLIVFGENNIIYKIDTYSSKKQEMNGVLIIGKDVHGNISYRVDAERVMWDGKQWVFFSGVLRNFGNSGLIIGEKIFSELKMGIDDDPRYFARETRNVVNMSLKEGYNYIKMMRKMGFSYRGLLTKFHRKIANSITLFLVIVIGLSLGSMSFRNAFVISFSMTLGIVLVFFFIIEIGYTFGSSGKISPIIGGWLGNIVFFIVCVFLLRRQRV